MLEEQLDDSDEGEIRQALVLAQSKIQDLMQNHDTHQLRATQEESRRRKDEATHDTQQQQLRAAQQEESQRLQQDLQSLQEKRPGESEEELHRSLRRELHQKQEELRTLQEETRQQCRTLELQLKSLENENAYLKTVYKEELDNRMVTQYRLQTLQKELNQSLLVNKEIPKALTYEDWFLPQIPTLLRS
jgi:flagellar biosynthesis GTPase FlhF